MFDHGQNRKVLAFCKSSEMQDIAKNTGAHLAGGKQLIKQIQVRYCFLQNIDCSCAHCIVYLHSILCNEFAKLISFNKLLMEFVLF